MGELPNAVSFDLVCVFAENWKERGLRRSLLLNSSYQSREFEANFVKDPDLNKYEAKYYFASQNPQKQE